MSTYGQKLKTTMMIKSMLYGAMLIIVLVYIIWIELRNPFCSVETRMEESDIKVKETDGISIVKEALGKGNVKEVHGISKDKDSHKIKYLQSIGLPADYFERDFITDNHLVDKLVPLLESNKEVIEEVQRIQLKMLTALIGKFKYAMLFNFAAFENKGDPAITVGKLRIIQKLGLKLVFHFATHCKNEAVETATELSQHYAYEDLVILMQGGGNLLSYISEDYNRKLVLETFPDFEVILFPQSLWNLATAEQFVLFREVYSKHKHLTFLYRDRDSLNLGKTLFPRVKCYLMPDIALHIKPTQRFMEPTHDILWIQRKDKESTKYEIPVNRHNYDVIVGDWLEWKTPKGSHRLEDSFLMAANGMMFVQRGRVVITDRLHGHILCVLCGIPHVVLDPVNNKTTSFMRSWTAGIENILVARSAEDALNEAISLLQKMDNKIPKALASLHIANHIHNSV